jgi:hypothetical protein
MSAQLKELLTDYAFDPQNRGVIDGLFHLDISCQDLDDAFFDAFDWRQRNRIYMALSVCSMPGVLETLQRRLAVEENGLCRRGLQGTINILNTPLAQLRAEYAAACQIFEPPARTAQYKRAFCEAVRQFAACPIDADLAAKIKAMAPIETDFDDELFDSLAPKARQAVYAALPQWCGPAALKKILDRRAPVETDPACHAAITEMLERFNGPAQRFNWKPDN